MNTCKHINYNTYNIRHVHVFQEEGLAGRTAIMELAHQAAPRGRDVRVQGPGGDGHEVALSQRETLEGWRVRQSVRMLSTVMDDEATRTVLAASVPGAVIEWLIENDAMFRCSTFETGVHAG